ncbi:MAG: ATP-binding protein [Clostridia bacterium]|nr:ATP-binding protein [Clostridia bacterium]
MKELKLDAVTDNLPQVMSFVDEALEAADCPMKAQMQIDMAVEEIFVNVSSYAYAPGVGPVTVKIGIADDPRRAIIVFEDQGVPYDPLAKADPDVTLSAEERQVGGLGIFMVKKTMDDMSYVYENNSNILTLTKRL